MKILLLGKNGQLGRELNRSLQALGDVTALDRSQADLSQPESLREAVRQACPDIIVNAAAYTAVDRAEQEPALAGMINSTAPAVLAQEAKKAGALLVHYSTDYVFDGSKEGAYLESDSPGPVNVYGQTKLAGEIAIKETSCDYLIFRTSWVYASRGHNFLLTILRLATERESLNIVADQVGAPTSARLLADVSASCIRQALIKKQSGDMCSGLYHLTASGKTSWYGFAKKIVELASKLPGQYLKIRHINAVPASEYPTVAQRPKNSCLNTDKIKADFAIELPDWESGLGVCMSELDLVQKQAKD